MLVTVGGEMAVYVNRDGGMTMKRIYEKPVLSKRGKLGAVTANGATHMAPG
jgi:hypothetical protein